MAGFEICSTTKVVEQIFIRHPFLKPNAQTKPNFIKKLLLKISQYADAKACNFNKKKLQSKTFPVNIAKFLKTPILKNICKRLLLHRYFA